ncbi:MAG: DUF2911 domain-containing protein [Terriglobales bacterium]
MRVLAVCFVLIVQSLLATAAQQKDATDQTATASCDFADGQEVSVEYNNSVMGEKDQPRNGKVWLPAGSPLTLFTQVPLTLNHVELAVGAYSIYVIPNKKEWTLIVSRNVSSPKTYDEKLDLVRAPMEIGGVDSPPKQLQVSFAHSAPKVCSIRLYYGTTGAFVEFNEK